MFLFARLAQKLFPQFKDERVNDYPTMLLSFILGALIVLTLTFINYDYSQGSFWSFENKAVIIGYGSDAGIELIATTLIASMIAFSGLTNKGLKRIIAALFGLILLTSLGYRYEALSILAFLTVLASKNKLSFVLAFIIGCSLTWLNAACGTILLCAFLLAYNSKNAYTPLIAAGLTGAFYVFALYGVSGLQPVTITTVLIAALGFSYGKNDEKTFYSSVFYAILCALGGLTSRLLTQNYDDMTPIVGNLTDWSEGPLVILLTYTFATIFSKNKSFSPWQFLFIIGGGITVFGLCNVLYLTGGLLQMVASFIVLGFLIYCLKPFFPQDKRSPYWVSVFEAIIWLSVVGITFQAGNYAWWLLTH